jgi:hypothetical protein
VIVNRVESRMQVLILAAKAPAATAFNVPLDALPDAVAETVFKEQDLFLWVYARYIERPSDQGGPQIDDSSWEVFNPPYDEGQYGSHPGHCCVDHGCKYNDRDCPVETGQIKQFFPCYDCDEHAFYKAQREQERYYWPPGEGEVPSLREALAALEHGQWAHWTRYMLTVVQGQLDDFSDEIVATVSPEAMKRLGLGKAHEPTAMPVSLVFAALPSVQRWHRQINTPYSKLTEKEKDSDREWADKVIRTVRKAEPMLILPDGWIDRAEALFKEVGVDLPLRGTLAHHTRPNANRDVFVSADGYGHHGTSSGPVTIKVDPNSVATSDNVTHRVLWPDEEAEPDPDDHDDEWVHPLADRDDLCNHCRTLIEHMNLDDAEAAIATFVGCKECKKRRGGLSRVAWRAKKHLAEQRAKQALVCEAGDLPEAPYYVGGGPYRILYGGPGPVPASDVAVAKGCTCLGKTTDMFKWGTHGYLVDDNCPLHGTAIRHALVEDARVEWMETIAKQRLEREAHEHEDPKP